MQGTITSHLAFGDNFLNSLHEATLLSPTVPLLTTNKRFISKYWPSHAILCRKKFSGCPWFLKSRLLNKMNKPLILSSQVSFPASSYSMFPLTLSELQPHGPFSSSNVSYWPPLWAFAHTAPSACLSSQTTPSTFVKPLIPIICPLGRLSWSDYVTWYPNQDTFES